VPQTDRPIGELALTVRPAMRKRVGHAADEGRRGWRTVQLRDAGDPAHRSARPYRQRAVGPHREPVELGDDGSHSAGTRSADREMSVRRHSTTDRKPSSSGVLARKPSSRSALSVLPTR